MDEADRARAEKYVSLCIEVIPLSQSHEDLEEWWLGEAERRHEYGLTKKQIDRIVLACKDQRGRIDTRVKQLARIRMERR